ncbi:hypothetical protein SLT67_16185 [Paenibacillus illinoisensis]|uniref:hypothetical protein n=1 Tax=Paenibacillus illinoisensis TaxID=59845 RepID=UPI003CE79C10
MRSSKFTPYLSFIGFGLFILTLIVHLSFRFRLGLDEGSLMLLSVANAVLLVFTLLWGIFGAVEFALLWRENKRIRTRFERGRMSKEEYGKQAKRFKTSFVINISYLVILLFQLGYVIMNWDEVDI